MEGNNLTEGPFSTNQRLFSMRPAQIEVRVRQEKESERKGSQRTDTAISQQNESKSEMALKHMRFGFRYVIA